LHPPASGTDRHLLFTKQTYFTTHASILPHTCTHLIFTTHITSFFLSHVSFFYHTSFLYQTHIFVPHTSFILPHKLFYHGHTSFLPHTSFFLPHTSFFLPHTSFFYHTHTHTHTSLAGEMSWFRSTRRASPDCTSCASAHSTVLKKQNTHIHTYILLL